MISVSPPLHGGDSRLAWICVSLGVLALTALAQQALPTRKQHKNVLVIVLDDLGTDKLEFYGQTPPTCPPAPCQLPPSCTPPPTGCVGPYPATPNLDRLRRQGIWFTKAYATPFCSSSRACIQTGRYGFRTGVGHLTSTIGSPGDFGLPDDEKLLAELVREGFHGASAPGLPYKCGAFGKWHVSTGLMSDWSHAVRNGYQRFYGSMGNVVNFYRYNKVVHDAGSAPGVVQVDGRFTTPPYGTDTWHASVTSRDARQWINAQSGAFLAYVAFGPPHQPLQVPPAELLSAATLCELTCAGLQPGDNGDLAPPEIRRLIFRAVVEAVDAELGKLLDGISREKRENTMVFVIGDNGTSEFVLDDPPHNPNHAKGYIYEWGIRVPLVVAGPLVKPPTSSEGWQSDALVSAVDLWSTIADITGADASNVVNPGELDSISFLPVLRDPLSAGNRTIVFSQLFLPNGETTLPPPSCYSQNARCTTDGVYKYLRIQSALSMQPCGVPSYDERLYHLPTDPEEATDLLSGSLTPTEAAALAVLQAEMISLSGF
jgi:arylsulfatase A-like enzyme